MSKPWERHVPRSYVPTHGHTPRVDNYGAVVCDTCTAAEARYVGGTLVHMYWGEGNCPGAWEPMVAASPETDAQSPDPADAPVTWQAEVGASLRDDGALPERTDPISPETHAAIYQDALMALIKGGIPPEIALDLMERASAMGSRLRAEREAREQAEQDEADTEALLATPGNVSEDALSAGPLPKGGLSASFRPHEFAPERGAGDPIWCEVCGLNRAWPAHDAPPDRPGA